MLSLFPLYHTRKSRGFGGNNFCGAIFSTLIHTSISTDFKKKNFVVFFSTILHTLKQKLQKETFLLSWFLPYFTRKSGESYKKIPCSHVVYHHTTHLKGFEENKFCVVKFYRTTHFKAVVSKIKTFFCCHGFYYTIHVKAEVSKKKSLCCRFFNHTRQVKAKVSKKEKLSVFMFLYHSIYLKAEVLKKKIFYVKFSTKLHT